ncbi:MAG: hypothetical protein PHU23_01145 [Dehalococcoidales bacterium]|nr:hypothetical protein [Dehalococcoidales bacterium]
MELRKVKPANLFGCPPTTWYQKKLLNIQNARTWHWGAFVMPIFSRYSSNTYDVTDWAISESGNKGTQITRLRGRHVYVYRIKDLAEVTLEEIIEAHSDYGDLPYDIDVNFRAAIWWIFKHYFDKVLPIEIDKAFNCQEWVCTFASILGVGIIPQNEYPTPYTLEHSPALECLGEVN